MTGQEPPNLAFVGVGWIGRSRMVSLLERGRARCGAIVDPSAEAREAAVEAAEGSSTAGLDQRPVELDAIDELWDLTDELDGIVIASPNAFHVEQSVAALEHELPVFCQKPLGRHAAECATAVEAARHHDRRLDVDLSYRYARPVQVVRELVDRGDIGRIYGAEFVFHNAYGPDQAWYEDPELAGGGCLLDLGVHLVDLALWTQGFPAVEHVSADIFEDGQRLVDGEPDQHALEDHVMATLQLSTPSTVRLACSWRIGAGCDAVIAFTLHGTERTLRVRNVDGSYFDLVAERLEGNHAQELARESDWGANALEMWAGRLERGEDRFDPSAEELLAVAGTLERIYRASIRPEQALEDQPRVGPPDHPPLSVATRRP